MYLLSLTILVCNKNLPVNSKKMKNSFWGLECTGFYYIGRVNSRSENYIPENCLNVSLHWDWKICQIQTSPQIPASMIANIFSHPIKCWPLNCARDEIFLEIYKIKHVLQIPEVSGRFVRHFCRFSFKVSKQVCPQGGDFYLDCLSVIFFFL